MKKTLYRIILTTALTAIFSSTAYADWKQDEHGYKYEKNGNYIENSWEKISGVWYYFNDNAYMHAGWLDSNGEKYYLYQDGSMATGEVLTDGKMFTFASNGTLQYAGVNRDGLESDVLTQAYEQSAAFQSEIAITLDKVNALRAAAGVSPVELDHELTIAATYRGSEMSKHNYFSHYDLEGNVRAGYVYRTLTNSKTRVNENIFRRASLDGTSLLSTETNLQQIDFAINGYVNSPGHYAIMLDSTSKKIGVGIYANADYTKRYTVLIFTE